MDNESRNMIGIKHDTQKTSCMDVAALLCGRRGGRARFAQVGTLHRRELLPLPGACCHLTNILLPSPGGYFFTPEETSRSGKMSHLQVCGHSHSCCLYICIARRSRGSIRESSAKGLFCSIHRIGSAFSDARTPFSSYSRRCLNCRFPLKSALFPGAIHLSMRCIPDSAFLYDGSGSVHLIPISIEKKLFKGVDMSKQYFECLLLILLPLFIANVRAGDFIHLDEIVVTTTKEDEEVRNISSKSLKTHRVVDLAEILSAEMVEATMIRKSGYGNEVSIRGFGKSDLRVTIDNGILEGACGSRKDPALSHINMLTVDRIEIREGPFDVTKAGALGGSINVTTINPQERVHGEILTKGGSYGYLSGGGYGTGGNKLLQALFGYNYSESDQYEDGDGNKLGNFAPGGRPYNAEGWNMKSFKKHDYWGKLQLIPSDNQTLRLSYSYGKAEDIMSPRVGMDIESEKTYMGRMEYSIRNLGDISDELMLAVYQNKVEHNPSDKYRELVGPPLFHRRNEVESTITGAKIENRRSADFATFTYGIDMYHRNWNGAMYNDEIDAMIDAEFFPDVDALNVGVYMKAEKDFENGSLSVGLRGDRFETEANDSLPNSESKLGITSNKQTDELPSGYLSGKYYLADNTHLFGGVGCGIRLPTATERYLQPPRGANFAGNPELKPTKNTEVDCGVQTTTGKGVFRIKAFYADLEDYIYQQATPLTWVNIDGHIYGADAKITIECAPYVYMDAGIAYQRGKKDSQPENNSNRNLAEIPPLKSILALRYDDTRFFGEAQWIHSDDADNADEDAGEQQLDSWDSVNLRAGCCIKQFAVNVGVANAFDKTYAVANSYEWDVVAGSGAHPAIVNEPGRFFYASISRNF